jgi:hypothetical protein
VLILGHTRAGVSCAFWRASFYHQTFHRRHLFASVMDDRLDGGNVAKKIAFEGIQLLMEGLNQPGGY